LRIERRFIIRDLQNRKARRYICSQKLRAENSLKEALESVANRNNSNTDLEFIHVDGINIGYLLAAKRSAM
jgi:hypothetical protein